MTEVIKEEQAGRQQVKAGNGRMKTPLVRRRKAGRLKTTTLLNVLLGNTIIIFRVGFSTEKSSCVSPLGKTLMNVSILFM